MSTQQNIEQWCRAFTTHTPTATIRVSAGGRFATVSFADRQFVVTEYEGGYSAVEVH